MAKIIMLDMFTCLKFFLKKETFVSEIVGNWSQLKSLMIVLGKTPLLSWGPSAGVIVVVVVRTKVRQSYISRTV